MRPLAILSLLFACAPGAAFADPCDSFAGGIPTGPVQAGFNDGGHGVARRVCPRHQISLGGGGSAVVEPDDFYGNIRVAGVVAGSIALTPDFELFGSFEAFRYQTVISSVSDDAMGIGHLALGGSFRFFTREDYALGVTAQVVIPTATDLYTNVRPVSADVGFVALYRLRSWLSIHGQVGLLFSAGISPAASRPRLGLLVNIGGALQPVDWFAFVLDLNMGYAYNAPVDLVAIAPAVRFAIGDHFGIELGGSIPFAGRERALAAAELELSWRF